MQEAIDADIAILGFLTWIIGYLPGADSMSLFECVDEFSVLMTQQLDMQVEANNLIKFRENFHRHSSLNSNSVANNNGGNSPATGITAKISSLFDSYLRQWRYLTTGVPARVTFPEPLMALTTQVTPHRQPAASAPYPPILSIHAGSTITCPINISYQRYNTRYQDALSPYQHIL